MGRCAVALLMAAAWLVATSSHSLSRARISRLAVCEAANRARLIGEAGAWAWPGTRWPARRRPADESASVVPSVLDVLAACLCAGAPVEQALFVVAQAFDGAAGRLLDGVARQAALGAPAETAWAGALADPDWAGVARSIVRAHYSGAPLADVLSRAADERRRELRVQAEGAASRAAVRAVLPLGICFLPAFILVGVVPVVAGFAGTLWG